MNMIDYIVLGSAVGGLTIGFILGYLTKSCNKKEEEKPIEVKPEPKPIEVVQRPVQKMNTLETYNAIPKPIFNNLNETRRYINE